jgi:hypothetical protein
MSSVENRVVKLFQRVASEECFEKRHRLQQRLVLKEVSDLIALIAKSTLSSRESDSMFGCSNMVAEI